MDCINIQVAQAAISGRLENNPFVQGLLLQALKRIDKDLRGVSGAGRQAACSETEHRLISGAALTFAICAGNKDLAVELGQNVNPPRLHVSDLHSFSLPNPAMSLRACNVQQLTTNLELVDQKFARTAKMSTKRLVLCLDHTYLDRSLCQVKLNDKYGLAGAAWSPMLDSDNAREFMEFGSLPRDAATTPRAPLMLECLMWHPAAVRQQCYSIASMPMSLAAQVDDNQDKNHGKRVSWR